MNFESRLQRITNNLKRLFLPTPRVVEVESWRGETEAQALKRYDILPNDRIIYIHIKSDEQIREKFK